MSVGVNFRFNVYLQSLFAVLNDPFTMLGTLNRESRFETRREKKIRTHIKSILIYVPCLRFKAAGI